MNWFWLNEIVIFPRCLTLSGLSPDTPVSLLRSVWGDIVFQSCRDGYDIVFAGRRRGVPCPGYVLRRIPGDGYRLLWILLGHAPLQFDAYLCRAWHAAGHRGIGPADNRYPFEVTNTALVARSPAGNLSGHPAFLRMGEACWPLPGNAAETPCRFIFSEGLHISSKSGAEERRRFVGCPDYPRLIKSIWNRLHPWLSDETKAILEVQVPSWLEMASTCPASYDWHEEPEMVKRWSSKKKRLQEYRAVKGYVDFPCGPGNMWPLLLSAYWLGIGHHTTEGMGGFDIVPLSNT